MRHNGRPRSRPSSATAINAAEIEQWGMVIVLAQNCTEFLNLTRNWDGWVEIQQLALQAAVKLGSNFRARS